MKQRGSAIVISMLLVSAIGVIAFGMGRFLFIQTQTSALYENGTVAYYAAESGIEEGFLRYRFDQNTEVPSKDWTLGPLDQSSVYETVFNDLTGIFSSPESNTGIGYKGVSLANNIDNTEQIYDLRMGYIGSNGLPFYGIAAGNSLALASSGNSLAYSSNGSSGAVFVPRDESIKLDLSGLNIVNIGAPDNNLKLYVKFYNKDAAIDTCYALMQVKFTINEGGTVREYNDIIAPEDISSDHYCESHTDLVGIIPSRLKAANSFSAERDVAGNYYYGSYEYDRLQDSMLSIPIGGASVQLTLRPLFYNAAIGLITESCEQSATNCVKDKTSVVPGPFTTINSTGYFGGVKKSLIANIDRQSGTLYDLYDYVIFKP